MTMSQERSNWVVCRLHQIIEREVHPRKMFDTGASNIHRTNHSGI